MKILIENNTVSLEYRDEIEVLSALAGLVSTLKSAGFKDDDIKDVADIGLTKVETKEKRKSSIKDLLKSLGLED